MQIYIMKDEEIPDFSSTLVLNKLLSVLKT